MIGNIMIAIQESVVTIYIIIFYYAHIDFQNLFIAKHNISPLKYSISRLVYDKKDFAKKNPRGLLHG